MEREYKNIRGEVKQLDSPGEGLAIISTFDVVDADGDVVRPGAFGEQTVQMIPTHNWQEAPIGKAKIRENGNNALAEFKLNLEMANGKEWYQSLKFDMDNPPPRQEYSYGFSVIKESRGEFEGQQVRFLEELKVHEISPVLVGASVGTTTLSLKEDTQTKKDLHTKQTTIEEDINFVKENIEKLLKRIRGIKEIRESHGREISHERIKEFIDIEKLLVEMREIAEPPKKKDHSHLVAKFYAIEKKLIDLRKEII